MHHTLAKQGSSLAEVPNFFFYFPSLYALMCVYVCGEDRKDKHHHLPARFGKESIRHQTIFIIHFFSLAFLVFTMRQMRTYHLAVACQCRTSEAVLGSSLVQEWYTYPHSDPLRMHRTYSILYSDHLQL